MQDRCPLSFTGQERTDRKCPSSAGMTCDQLIQIKGEEGKAENESRCLGGRLFCPDRTEAGQGNNGGGRCYAVVSSFVLDMWSCAAIEQWIRLCVLYVPAWVMVIVMVVAVKDDMRLG